MPANRPRNTVNHAYTIKIIGDGNRWVCHYCGCPADTTDHIPPLTRYHDALELGPFKPVRVPCCSECNILAGNELHISFVERAAYIKERLAVRYTAQLRVVEWTEDELKEMSYQFRVSLERDLGAKRFIEARIAYFPT